MLPMTNSIIVNVLRFFVSQNLTFGYFRKPTPAFELLRVREPPAGIFGSRKWMGGGRFATAAEQKERVWSGGVDFCERGGCERSTVCRCSGIGPPRK